MGFDKVKIKQIRNLMILGAALVLALMYSKSVFLGIVIAIGMIRPFIYGGAVAFVLNIPMKAIETKLLKRWNGKVAKHIKRPICMVLSIIVVVVIISTVVLTVVPQLSKTIAEIGNKIPTFIDTTFDQLEKISAEYPQIQEQILELEKLELNWQDIINKSIDFLKNGVGTMLTSTFTFAGNIIGGTINFIVAIIFALYILAQKEKLGSQGRRILSAYLPEKASQRIQYILSILYKNFSNFITGQCLEAVILGSMFVIAMTIFRMPYAVMVGILIAFTALIPIVGAFIGCFVGAFLILISNPMQALWFVILFLILQQIEGNLIYPRVVGSSVGLPAIWVLMAVSIGGSLFGVVGMLIFIPILSTVYTLLRENVNKKNKEKGIGCKQKVEEVATTVPVSKEGTVGGKKGDGKDK